MKETRAKGKKGLSGALASLGGKQRTVTRTYKTPMLILCTGKHVSPYVPELPNDGSVPVIHSSQVGARRACAWGNRSIDRWDWL